MMEAVDFPAWAALTVSLLVLAGAGLALIGCVGLLRLLTFYQRVHASTLGTTLGAGMIIIASILFFSIAGSRPVLHEVLIGVFLTVTTPVSFILLVKATRRRSGKETSSQPRNDDSTKA